MREKNDVCMDVMVSSEKLASFTNSNLSMGDGLDCRSMTFSLTAQLEMEMMKGHLNKTIDSIGITFIYRGFSTSTLVVLF